MDDTQKQQEREEMMTAMAQRAESLVALCGQYITGEPDRPPIGVNIAEATGLAVSLLVDASRRLNMELEERRTREA